MTLLTNSGAVRGSWTDGWDTGPSVNCKFHSYGVALRIRHRSHAGWALPCSQFLLELVGAVCSQAEGDLVSLEEEERKKGRKKEGEGEDWEIMKISFSQDVPVCTGMAFSLPLWINCSPSRKNEQALYLKSHLTFMTKINWILCPKLAFWMLFFSPRERIIPVEFLPGIWREGSGGGENEKAASPPWRIMNTAAL